MEVVPEPEAPASPSGVLLGVAVVLGLGTFVVVGTALQVVDLGAGLWVSDLFCFVGLPALLLRQAGWNPVRLVGLDGPSVRAVLLGFAAGAANVFAWVVPLMWVSAQVLPRKLIEASDQSEIFEKQTPIGLVLVVGAVSIAAPVCEEFLFRGLLLRGLSARLGARWGIAVCALVFAASHYRPALLVPLFEIGVLLGLLTARSRTVWAAIGAHAANNLLESAEYFVTGASSADTPSAAIVLAGFAAGNVVLVGLFVLARRRPVVLASPRPAEAVRAEPGDPAKLVRLGLATMALAYALLVAIDFRGAQVTLADNVAWLPKLPADAPPEQKAGRVVVEAERRKLLDGKTTFEAYLQERREQQRRESK